MKTQNKKIIKGVLIGLAVLIAIPFCFGIYAGFTSHTGATGDIITALENECVCEEVSLDISAYGIQFSKTDGVTGDKVSYLLKNCTFETSAQDFVATFNKQQNDAIDGYADLDLIEYHFHTGEEQQVITVKNGALQ